MLKFWSNHIWLLKQLGVKGLKYYEICKIWIFKNLIHTSKNIVSFSMVNDWQPHQNWASNVGHRNSLVLQKKIA